MCTIRPTARLLQDGVRVLTRTMQRASTALGDPAGRIRNRLRSVTRRVLIIGYQARSPKTRDAMVKSYRKLMATTRAVLRDTDDDGAAPGPTRAHGQSARSQPMLQRAQRSAAGRCGRSCSVSSTKRARGSWAATRTSPDKVLSLFEPHTDDDSQGQDLEAERVRQAGDHSRIGTSDHHGVRGPRGATRRRDVVDAGAWIGIRRSSAAPRISPPAIAASARRRTNRRRRTAACDAWSCRGAARSRRRDARMNANAGSGAGNAGASAAKAASVCSNGAMDCDRCRYHGVDGMHRWVGFGVIADNLMNIATFAKARATA